MLAGTWRRAWGSPPGTGCSGRSSPTWPWGRGGWRPCGSGCAGPTPGINWARQREGEDARLLLRAALAAGEPEAGAKVRAWAEGYGDDVRLEPLLSQLSASVRPQP
jgi:hypothetical protein